MSDLFDWDEANIKHIARHDVTPHEAEEALLNDPIDLAYEVRNGEGRSAQIGETLVGRVLFVVTTMRKGKVRVVTARPQHKRLYKRYLLMKEKAP